MSKTAYGSNYKSAFDCHTDVIEVMQIGNCRISAGRYADMNHKWFDLRVRMIDDDKLRDDRVVIANDGAKSLLPPEVTELAPPPTLDIDWPDFGTPSLDKQWWTDFVTALQVIDQDTDVGVYCYGGHGRTGTALAILGSLAGLVPVGKDAVSWVRENYCDSAVESWGQIDYIEEITGETILARPSSFIQSGKSGWQSVITPQSKWEKINGNWVKVDHAKGTTEVSFEKPDEWENPNFPGMSPTTVKTNPAGFSQPQSDKPQSKTATALIEELNKRTTVL